MSELHRNRTLNSLVFVHLEQSGLWFSTSVAQMQTRAERGGTLVRVRVRARVSQAVCGALCSRGLFYVAVCPVYVLLPLLCAPH